MLHYDASSPFSNAVGPLSVWITSPPASTVAVSASPASSTLQALCDGRRTPG